MNKWIKVYFTREQYDEWRSGNGKAIGYTEEEVRHLQKLQSKGFDVHMKTDPLDHMTKVAPCHVSPIGWSLLGVHVRKEATP